MKRIIAIFLTLILGLTLLAGCSEDTAATTAPTGPSVPGTSQTFGRLTVFVPEGWTPVFAEDQADQLYLCKGGSDINTTPYIKITLDGALPSKQLCTNVETVEAQVYGNLTWDGFSGAKTNGNATYLTTNLEGGSLLATLWSNKDAEHLSLEDTAIQAILGNISVAAASEPAEPEVPETRSVAGDWSGTMEIIAASGDLAEKDGLTCKAIARILTSGDNMTPYIGLAEEGGTITNMVHTPATEGTGAQTTGTWNGIPFDNAEIAIDGDRLSVQIPIFTETGSALLQMSLFPATDFEAQATELGCTGYPSK